MHKVTELSLPSSVNPKKVKFFPGKRVKFGNEVLNQAKLRKEFKDTPILKLAEPVSFVVFKMDEGENNDNFITSIFNVEDNFDNDQDMKTLLPLLELLSGSASWLLDRFPAKKQVHLIYDYQLNDKLEPEPEVITYKAEEDEVEISTREPNTWGNDDLLLVLVAFHPR